jgi:hypothetical protein
LTRRSITPSRPRFLRQQLGIQEGIEQVQRQLERMQDQVGCFVISFRAAMAEEQLGGIEG